MMLASSNARRVRRSELDNADNSTKESIRSESPDPEVSTQLQARLASLYSDVIEETHPGALIKTALTSDEQQAKPGDRPEPEEGTSYIFRLFSSHPRSTGTADHTISKPEAQRITISSPPPSADHDASFGGILSSRHRSHYHTSASPAWSNRRRDEFEDHCVAVSGSWVLAQSRQRNQGLEVRWRVKNLKVSRRQFAALSDVKLDSTVAIVDPSLQKRRTKPSKKRRLMLKQKERKKATARLEAEMITAAKELEDREKRTRRNREKKVKRKARDKIKKAETSPANQTSS